MNPFDFINAINFTKKNLIVDEETEKAYQPFSSKQNTIPF